MRHQFFTLPLTLVTAMATVHTAYAEDFVVRDIRIEGLVRLSTTSVLSLLPIKIGDTISDQQLAETLRRLYASGHFDDVQARRDDQTLYLNVVERPVISTIKLEGNKLIPEDTLKTGLKSVGLVEGQELKRSVLQSIENELESQYAQQGRYDADVKIETTPRPNNRIDLTFKIYEGNAARVVDIKIIGNSVFSEKDIQLAFAVKESSWSSIMTRDDRYARERLSASLEALRAKYLNNGYINFAVNSAQLNLSEDKKRVFIEVSVSEGQQYRFAGVKYAGDLLYSSTELEKLSLIKSGELYSQARVMATKEALSKAYGNGGYYFSEINPIPEIDDINKTVTMSYFINPGRQVYVRRINFTGNTKTADDVLRREMRQMEGALASNEKIDLSKLRLERTGYFKSVSIDPQRVPNTNDQIDLNIKVEEQTSGTSTIAVGYSASGGITFQLGLSQTNFLGTGHRVNIDLSRSETLDNYNIGILDPYFTIDGISRGYNVYYRQTKLDNLSVNNYVTDSIGGALTFGYPVDETKDVSVSLNVDQTTINTGSFVAKSIRDFIIENGGKATSDDNKTYRADYTTYNLNLSWVHSTLNRPVFATSGQQHRFSFDVAVPGSDLEYQRLTYDGQVVFPLGKNFALRGYTKLGYGHDLPFYKNYFAGGYGSVRGYRNNTLGPRSVTIDTLDTLTGEQAILDQEPVGGNALVQGGMELVLPLPFKGDWAKQIRPVLFAEGGQVFDTTVDKFKMRYDDYRFSAGFGFTWITVIGPLSLSYAYPINSKADQDETKRIQFEIGRLF